ncbi:MAG: helix-turn-helix domain-containing protein [Oscillospiraceae bacterium]|nr:helix-turn-helix domain-containing protein [Oscillospiraceae bacterium]
MNRIRKLRKERNLTQKELAKHLKVADSTLSYWEMGKYEPDSNALMKLSEFFQVPIDYILCGKFSKWNISDDRTLYPENYSSQLTSSETFVSEAITIYNKNSKSNNNNGHHSLQNAFDRVEFTGLTQEEIDILAEYAVFIKSRRKSGK